MHARTCRLVESPSPVTMSRAPGPVVAVGAHVIAVLAVGLIRCSGVLYVSWRDEFETSAVQTGAIGSIITSCSFFGSPLAAVVCDRFGCRVTGLTSGITLALGLFVSSWVKDVYQMYVTSAIIGLGVSFAFMSANVVISEYFTTYFTLANGFGSSGIGLGMIVQPLLMQLLLDRYGWRGAMMILAGLSGNICVFGALFRPVRPRTRRVRVVGSRTDSNELGQTEEQLAALEVSNKAVRPGDQDSSWIRQQAQGASSRRSIPVCFSTMASTLGLDLLHMNYRFTLFCLVQVQFSISYMSYIIFLVPRARSVAVEETSAAFLVSIVGIGSLVGRLASGCLIQRKLTARTIFAFFTFVCSVGVLSAQLDSYGAFAASASLIGLGSGVAKSAHNVLVRDFVGVSNFGRGLGTADIFRGIGNLAGPVIAGQLFDVTGNYVAMFYVIAALFLAIVIQMAILMPMLRRLEPDEQPPVENDSTTV